jgi:hypothetical protein
MHSTTYCLKFSLLTYFAFESLLIEFFVAKPSNLFFLIRFGQSYMLCIRLCKRHLHYASLASIAALKKSTGSTNRSFTCSWTVAKIINNSLPTSVQSLHSNQPCLVWLLFTVIVLGHLVATSPANNSVHILVSTKLLVTIWRFFNSTAHSLVGVRKSVAFLYSWCPAQRHARDLLNSPAWL